MSGTVPIFHFPLLGNMSTSRYIISTSTCIIIHYYRCIISRYITRILLRRIGNRVRFNCLKSLLSNQLYTGFTLPNYNVQYFRQTKMAAVQTNTYISQQITSFRSAVQRLRDSTLLKIGEGNVESTIANNLPQVRSEISAIVNAHEDAFPSIAALWRDATPLPDLTAHPHPGEMAPTAQQQRDIDVYDKLHERELIEREMHRLLVDGLYTLARPTYHHRMEIDQPAVGGLVDRGINGQDLSTAWALLRGTVGNPRSANLNVLENRMKTCNPGYT